MSGDDAMRRRMRARGRPARALARRWMGIGAAVLALAACGDRQGAAIAPQQWHQMRVQVQTQPDPPSPGANEVLVILAAPRDFAAYESIVSLRTSDEDPWIQAIQDGHTGVYRRVVRLDPPQRSTLQVRIDLSNQQTVLSFPLLTASH